MKTLVCTLLTCLITFSIQAQQTIEQHAFSVNELNSKQFSTFFSEKVKNTQFIMLGEEHGIQEVGQITNALYNIAKPEGYTTLCIETSPFAANLLENRFEASKNITDVLKYIYEAYLFSIPFYNNKSDIDLFKNVIATDGEIWGIDQIFIAEFRLVFDYFVHQNDNKALSNAVKPLLATAIQDFEKTIREKDFQAPFIFKYTNTLHQKLLALTVTEAEKKLLEDLKLTREIYMYNFQKEYYMNNNERAKLMKRNFLNYYEKAAAKGKLPKVIFKLGANHAAKGFTSTNVLDISNMVTEMAMMNGKTSLHVYAVGIDGTKSLGNPFVAKPIVPFDSSETLPKEVQLLTEKQPGKYIVIDTHPLRAKVHKLSSELKKLVLQYDVLVYIRDCKPLTTLN